MTTVASTPLRRLAGTLPIVLPLALAYGPVLASLARQWAEDPNYAHGFFVLPLALVLAWRRRDRVLGTPREPDPIGLALVAAAGLLYLAGIVAAELFSTRVSMVLVVAGLVWTLEGRARLRALAFPITFLLCMVPLPYVFYYQLTFPLQLESSRLAAGLLGAAGMPILRDGNILHVEDYSLEVVSACSGLRSIMTLGTLALFLTDFVPLTRVSVLVLMALVVPVAIAANVVRLALTAGLAAVGGPETAESFLHGFSGIVVFITGLAALVACAKALQWIERARR
jgi:exosortase